ncbi:hypothetical protein MCOR27_002912 [Pyricularia oryzae]|uniref:Uncharacterized protein n=2 Tax=Pyricularia TaxID=48558 RepID=A0ABQ8NUS1_PYRGI|nr:hypothetical protein MCOR01_000479 [Pyricularia oryzae]KAI6301923.1 hypothetical protein MCOR33_002647 [Pyricularia grisea]KAH9428777.1 hypothetical protein MCOR02_011321 [Pyricularia oryzae]KAI6252757.1 hypothetical protein MCOR19_010640 [Pyricularia oryzae]KAI6268348.1 hypothetical protein MCOR26_009239 [Pyricularia oryzae]
MSSQYPQQQSYREAHDDDTSNAEHPPPIPDGRPGPVEVTVSPYERASRYEEHGLGLQVCGDTPGLKAAHAGDRWPELVYQWATGGEPAHVIWGTWEEGKGWQREVQLLKPI